MRLGGLKARLLGAFLLVSVVPVGLVGLVVYRQGEATLRDQALAGLSSVADLKGQQLEAWLRERHHDVVRPASIANVQRLTAILTAGENHSKRQAAAQELRSILSRIHVLGGFAEIFLVETREGRVVLSTDLDQEGKIKTDEPYFREGLEGPHTQYVYYSLPLQKPVITFAALVPGSEGRPAAMLVGLLDLRFLDRLMAERSGLSRTGQTFLVNRSNYFVSESLGQGVHGYKPVFSDGVKLALAGGSGTGLYTNHEGRPVVAAYRWLPDLGLALIAEVDQDEAFAPIRTFRIVLIAALGIVGAVAVLLGAGFSFATGRPITRLVETVQAIGGGDLERRADVSQPSELGVLASAVNRMAGDLQASRRELETHNRTLELRVAARTEESEARRRRAEALFETAQLISRSLDPDLVARQIVASVGRLFRTNAITLYRLEAETGDLVALAFAGAPGIDCMTVLPRGTGLAGAAVRERKPVVTEDLLADPQIALSAETRTQITQASIRAALAVPLLIQDRVIGALGIGDKPGRVFHEEEIQLAQALASQAAVALENARLYRHAQEALEELSRTQDQLVQTQKIEAIGRLAGGVAHDFNNLLAIILGRSQMMLGALPPEHPQRRNVALIQQTAERAAQVTRQLLAFSRKQILQPKILDLNALVSSVLTLLRRLIREDIEFSFVPHASDARVKADPAQLEIVLMNLTVNAGDAMPQGGRLTIETSIVQLDEGLRGRDLEIQAGPYVMLAVSDTGVGMDADTVRHIFEPFFTTKEMGKGTGLGLATVHGIVKQSGGAISVYSESGVGTTFKVYLPYAPVEAAPAAPVVEAPARGAGETVLVVEDEAELREIVEETLGARGYRVLGADGPLEALEIVARHEGPIDLLLTDVVMPKMSGRDLAERARAAKPTLRVLYMSGYTDEAIVQHGVLNPGVALIQKPFGPDDLARAVAAVLDGRPVA